MTTLKEVRKAQEKVDKLRATEDGIRGEWNALRDKRKTGKASDDELKAENKKRDDLVAAADARGIAAKEMNAVHKELSDENKEIFVRENAPKAG